MKAENSGNRDCPQRDSAEHEGYAEVRRSFRSIWKEKDSAQPKLLEKILYKDNLNRAFKRVKVNKGAPGIDGITVDEIGAYLRENQQAIIERIYKGKYTPDPVRRKEIPKADGGMRKLGIPTVKDRIFQRAIAQQLMPMYEIQFSGGSYGYRPGRNAKDERVIQWIKRYLGSGVMENGVVMDTKEDSQQGGNLSPLLANVYLNEFDQEFQKRGVPLVRYADDIVLLAKSERAAKRLLETSTNYLEGKLKLIVNKDKSRVVSVFAIRNFKFLGFVLGRNGKGIYVRVHPKSWKKFKSKLKELSSRRSAQSIRPALEKIKVIYRGWLNYFGIASMKNPIDDINKWLYHRIRICIWKQWKKPKTKMRNLLKLGVSKDLAFKTANSRRGY